MASQTNRGGGTVCTEWPSLHAAIYHTISSEDTCSSSNGLNAKEHLSHLEIAQGQLERTPEHHHKSIPGVCGCQSVFGNLTDTPGFCNSDNGTMHTLYMCLPNATDAHTCAAGIEQDRSLPSSSGCGCIKQRCQRSSRSTNSTCNSACHDKCWVREGCSSMDDQQPMCMFFCLERCQVDECHVPAPPPTSPCTERVEANCKEAYCKSQDAIELASCMLNCYTPNDATR